MNLCDIIVVGDDSLNLNIDAFEDKNPIYCKLTNDLVLNITGEGGSGKTTYSRQYRDNPEYIVIDYDIVLLGNASKMDFEFYLRKKIEEKYGESIFKSNDYHEAIRNFTIIYEEIINILQNTGKKIVLDGTQLRFIDDVKKIKGELIVLRPSVETCIQRSVNRKQMDHPELSDKELKEYEKRRRETLYRLNPLLNKLINNIAEITNFEELTIEDSIIGIKL